MFTFGTASALRVEGIDICGKTGTAAFAKINGIRTKLEDHSICCLRTQGQSKNNCYFGGKRRIRADRWTYCQFND
jgi:hypothetical protein